MIRNVFVVFVFSTLLVYGFGCASPEQNQTVKSAQDSPTHVYEVFGMDCPGCHGGVEKLVKKLPGVLEAQANWEKKRLAITVRPGTQLKDEDVYDAIRRANFTPGKRIK